MLKLFRKNTKVIIWLIILAFILWGAFSIVSLDKKGRYAGEVFGKGVSFQEYNLFLSGSQIFSFTGKPSEDPNVIHMIAWQNIVFDREAKRRRIDVSDDEVRKELRRLLNNAGIGDADAKTYRLWLRGTLRMEPQDFEKLLREMMRIQKLIKIVSQMPVEAPSEQEVRNFYMLQNTKADIESVIVDTKEQAEELANSVKSAEDWDRLIKEKNYAKLPFGKTPLLTPVRAFNLSTEAAARLAEVPAGQVSPPLEVKDKFLVIFVKAKEPADMNAFEQKKDELMKTAVERKKQAYVTAWNMEVMQRANLKDYTEEQQRPAAVETSASAPQASEAAAGTASSAVPGAEPQAAKS